MFYRDGKGWGKMKRNKYRVQRTCVALTALIIGANAAIAAPEVSAGNTNNNNQVGGPINQEITVTATRRSLSTSKVPESIVAYSQQSLDAQGVRSLEDLATITPGVDFSRNNEGNGSLTNISIRGIVSNTEAPTTGVYIDDTPTQVRANGLSLFGTAVPNLFDLDRVEVLRGPQGTLFGAGSEGGAIRFILAQPSLTKYSGNFRTEVASTDGGGLSMEGGAAVGGPIIDDKLGFRLSVDDRHDGGYVDRVNPVTGAVRDKNSNSADSQQVRLAFTLAPTDWLSATASVLYTDQKVNDTSAYWENLSSASNLKFQNGRNIAEPSRDKMWLPTLHLQADLGFAQLISASSYTSRDVSTTVEEGNAFGYEYLGNPFIGANASAPEAADGRIRQLTQELRLQSSNASRFQWIIGGFYQRLSDREHQQADASDFKDIVEQTLGGPLYLGKYVWYVSEHAVDKQYAGFGEASYQILSTLKATAGVRVARFNTHYTRQAIGPIYGGSASYDLHAANTAVTPKFNLTWQATPDLMLYGTASKGVRQGGVNRAAFTLPTCKPALAQLGLSDFPRDYKPDSLWNYEIGSKGKIFGDRIRYEASAFYDEWTSVQRKVAPAECGGSNFTANLGKATSKGFDLSLLTYLTKNLSVNIQAAYTDAKYDDTLTAGSTYYVVSGDTLGVTPWQLTATGRYERQLFTDKNAYLQAQAQYHSRNKRGTEVQDILTASYDPDIPTPAAYTLVNMRAGLMFNGVDASIYVNNMLNSHAQISRLHNDLGEPLYYDRTLRPRTIGLTVTYRG